MDKDLSLHKKSYETFFLKGLILFRLKNFEESIECFNKAAEDRNQKFLVDHKKIERMKKIRKFEKALLYYDSAKSQTSLDDNFSS